MWRVDQLFDLAGISNVAGAPSFRVVCERVGGRLSSPKFKFQRYESEVPTLAKDARMGHPRHGIRVETKGEEPDLNSDDE